MATNVWYVGPTPAGYIYAYTYRWDESTPENSRTKAAKLYKDQRLEQIGPLMDGWMEVKPIENTGGPYAPAAHWWVDPVLLYQKAEPEPDPDPEPIPLDLTEADCVSFVKVLLAIFGS